MDKFTDKNSVSYQFQLNSSTKLYSPILFENNDYRLKGTEVSQVVAKIQAESSERNLSSEVNTDTVQGNLLLNHLRWILLSSGLQLQYLFGNVWNTVQKIKSIMGCCWSKLFPSNENQRNPQRPLQPSISSSSSTNFRKKESSTTHHDCEPPVKKFNSGLTQQIKISEPSSEFEETYSSEPPKTTVYKIEKTSEEPPIQSIPPTQKFEEFSSENVDVGVIPIDRRSESGIQWANNSCYLDALLFVMFKGVENGFQKLLRNGNYTSQLQIDTIKCLNEIYSKLSIFDFCPSKEVTLLRELMPEKFYDEYIDVEEAIYVLYEEILELDPFLVHSTGDTGFIHMITLGITPSQKRMITLSDLLKTSFHEIGNPKLLQTPHPALIVQLPMCDGKLQQFDYIFPDPILKIDHFMDGTGSGQELKLKGIICVKSQHYTAFVLLENGNWIYFDSFEPYTEVVSGLSNWLENTTLDALEKTNFEKLPEACQRLLTSSYMCFYSLN